MSEFVHEIDQDDLEEYRQLSMAQTALEMRLLQFHSYVEKKYLAGAEYGEGDCYVDLNEGIIYLWS